MGLDLVRILDWSTMIPFLSYHIACVVSNPLETFSFSQKRSSEGIDIPASTIFFFPTFSRWSLKSVAVNELGCCLWIT